MAGLLALVGGVEFTAGNEQQDRELAAAAAGGIAFVVPTAAARQRPDLAVEHASSWFRGLGVELHELRVLTRTDAGSEQLAAEAAKGRLFYLVGGDPGHVAQTLRGSRVWEAILGAWQAGAALAGSSAGAMALGEWTLIRARWPDHVTRAYREALGLVPDLTVLPHFEKFGQKWVESATAAAPRPHVTLLGIAERSAALWDAGGWRAAGPGRITVIRDGQTRDFQAGSAVAGLPEPRVA